jgi:hypothetical protein
VDWATVGLLALLVVIDGWRRVPADAVVLRRAPWTPWRVVPPSPGRNSGRLLSWAAPFSLTILLGNPPDETPRSDVSVARLAGRTLILRVLGALTTLLLVIGIAVAGRWLGGVGFLAAAGLVLVCSGATAALAVRFARALAPERDRSIRWALPVASPFGTARAAEVFLERMLAGSSPVAVAREVLGSEDFAAWVRPAAFDRVRVGLAPAPGLESVLDLDAMRLLLETRPSPTDGAEAFCPRCGEGFTDPQAECPECAVALEPY